MGQIPRPNGMGDGTGTPNSGRAFRFCTDDLPEQGRIAATREMLSRAIWRFDFEPAPGTPFFARGRMQAVPGLGLVEIETSEGRTLRTSRHIADDQYLFNLCLAGSSRVGQCGRELVVGPGDAVLTMGAECAAMQFSESRFLSFGIPARTLSALVPDAQDRVARPVRNGTGALELLTAYARIVQDSGTLAAPEAGRIAVSHIHDLVALALGAARDAGEAARERGARAARLRAIKADIENDPGREDWSIGAVAAAHRLPVRYVQRLFEQDGTTFTAFLLERRLAYARRLLANPHLAHRKINALAMEAGFGNLSYFSQVFRRHYGLSPSDVRPQRTN
jgi:AraC-like DNA-binding protein